jgi:hypothetical protein
VELEGPRAKLDWAMEQLRAFDAHCQIVLNERPFRIEPEFDEERGCFILRFRFREDVFPKYLGLRVGDVVHNARSALDHAVWLIACRSNPVGWLWDREIGWQIAFPVAWKEASFRKHRVMPFITDDAKAILAEFQPYRGGDIGQAIGDLDTLWNIDKHRVMHRSAAQLDVSKIGFRPGGVRIEDLEAEPDTTWNSPLEQLVDGTEIASVRFRGGVGPPYTTVMVTGEPTAVLAFGSGPASFSIDVIGGMLVRVHEVLSRIESLPENAPVSEAAKKAGL